MRRNSGTIRQRIEYRLEIDADAYENNRPCGRFKANTSSRHGLHEKGDFGHTTSLSFFLSFTSLSFVSYFSAMFRNIIVVLAFLFAFTQISTSTSLDDDEYDFIVVGSGAGGGPLACRLAEANFKTLLIEAGNDQGDNVNTSIPAFQGVVAQDPKVRWDVSAPDRSEQKQRRKKIE